MSENKRFRVNDLVKYNYSEIGEYIDENHTDTPLRNDILVELLNEQQARIEKLEKEKIELKEENKRLNAFLVHKCFAEEYIRWKREGEQFEENIYTPSKKPMRFIGGKRII